MSITFTWALPVAAVCYLAAASCAAAGLAFTAQDRRGAMQSASPRLALLGFALHSLTLLRAMLTVAGWDNSYFLHLAAWLFMFVYLAMRRRVQADFLNMACAFPAGLLILAGMFMQYKGLTQLQGAPYFNGPLFIIHVAAMAAGLSCMLIGCGAGLAFLYLERKIKRKKSLNKLIDDFPPLAGLDRAGRLAVLWGFPLFSIGLVAGFIWAGRAWGEAFSWDIKEIASGLIWLVYAALLYIRLKGSCGRRPAQLAVWIFGLSLFSLLVVNVFLPSHHSFMPWQG